MMTLLLLIACTTPDTLAWTVDTPDGSISASVGIEEAGPCDYEPVGCEQYSEGETGRWEGAVWATSIAPTAGGYSYTQLTGWPLDGVWMVEAGEAPEDGALNVDGWFYDLELSCAEQHHEEDGCQLSVVLDCAADEVTVSITADLPTC